MTEFQGYMIIAVLWFILAEIHSSRVGAVLSLAIGTLMAIGAVLTALQQ